MTRLSKIAFDVLCNHQNDDLTNAEIRIRIANEIENNWKNVVKEVAKSELMKKAEERKKSKQEAAKKIESKEKEETPEEKAEEDSEEEKTESKAETRTGNEAAKIVLSAIDAYQDKVETRTDVRRQELVMDDNTRLLLERLLWLNSVTFFNCRLVTRNSTFFSRIASTFFAIWFNFFFLDFLRLARLSKKFSDFLFDRHRLFS